MSDLPVVVGVGDVPADTRRGGRLCVVLGPRTVGCTSGFMGVVTLRPGERVAEHYHPYSEEFLYLVRGTLEVDLDGHAEPLRAEQGMYIAMNVRHRLRNVGDEDAVAVFQLGPLAPRPELGHVDTEGGSAPSRPEPARGA